MKIFQVVFPLVMLGGACAFAPSNTAFVARSGSTVLFMSTPSPPPVPPMETTSSSFSSEMATKSTPITPAPPSSPSTGGKLVPIKEETVEFTAGILGGVAGFAVGGPLLAAIGAAVANYVSRNGKDADDVINTVSKSALEVYNSLARLDGKYEVLAKAQASLQSTYDKVKANPSVDPETIKKIEDALASTTAKINQINEEYDLVGASLTAFGVLGDLIERAVKKAGEINKEYKLTDKALQAINEAVDRAKTANQAKA